MQTLTLHLDICYLLGNEFDNYTHLLANGVVVERYVVITPEELANIATQENCGLLIKQFSDDLVKLLSGNIFSYVAVDVSSIAERDELYAAYCDLRQFTQSLFFAGFDGEISRLYDCSNKIEISVIFPVYNVAQYLERCFENFFKFKHPFIELIAVDDGSTDDSRVILAELQKKDLRIKVLAKQNGGCASARMFGLQQASGRYVVFIDPDDFVEHDFLLKLHQAAIFSACQVVQCGYNHFYNNTQVQEAVIENSILENYYVPQYSAVPFYDLLRTNTPAVWRRLYLREFLISNNIEFPVEIRRFDDLPFFIHVFIHCTSFMVLPECLYNYQVNRPGQDLLIDDERLFVLFDIFDSLQLRYINHSDRDVILANLLVCRLNSHLWALKMLKVELIDDYICRMLVDSKIHLEHFVASFKAIYIHYGIVSIANLLFIGLKTRQKWLVKLAIRIFRK